MEFTHTACSCAAHIIVSVSLLRCLPFNHSHVLSVLTFSESFTNLPWSGFSGHWLLFSSLKRFLNASRCSTSDNPFSPDTYFNIQSSLSLRYLSKLYTSAFTHFSHLISSLSPSFLGRYNLPTFPLGRSLHGH